MEGAGRENTFLLKAVLTNAAGQLWQGAREVSVFLQACKDGTNEERRRLTGVQLIHSALERENNPGVGAGVICAFVPC